MTWGSMCATTPGEKGGCFLAMDEVKSCANEWVCLGSNGVVHILVTCYVCFSVCVVHVNVVY